jgi:small subunit ribosomal protein S8
MDNLANLFSIIQNGQSRYKIFVQAPFSKKSWNICNVLFLEGLLKGFLVKENFIYIFLKYSENKPVIQKIKKISLQGRRLYNKKGGHFNYAGLNLISTSKGIMTERDSIFLGIGGEVLCTIY